MLSTLAAATVAGGLTAGAVATAGPSSAATCKNDPGGGSF